MYFGRTKPQSFIFVFGVLMYNCTSGWPLVLPLVVLFGVPLIVLLGVPLIVPLVVPFVEPLVVPLVYHILCLFVPPIVPPDNTLSDVHNLPS